MKNKNNTDKLREEIVKKFRYKFVTDSFMGLIMGKPRYIGNETHEVKDIEKFIKQALTQACQQATEEAVERIEKFCIERCDSFEQVGIHRCSYGHCERCGECDVLSDLLVKIGSKLEYTT